MISLVLYATKYFFYNSCTSEYKFFYTDNQYPFQDQQTLTLSGQDMISAESPTWDSNLSTFPISICHLVGHSCYLCAID